jgi:hypothetical protein
MHEYYMILHALYKVIERQTMFGKDNSSDACVCPMETYSPLRRLSEPVVDIIFKTYTHYDTVLWRIDKDTL